MAFVSEAIRENAIEAYVSVLGRAPSQAELADASQRLADGTLAGQGALIGELIRTPEGVAEFGGLTVSEGIDVFFNNLVNRDATAAEKTAVEALVGNQGATQAIATVVNYFEAATPQTARAQDPRSDAQITADSDLISNKIAVAEYFATQGPGTADGASRVLDDVTASTDTSSKQAIESFVESALAGAGTTLDVSAATAAGADVMRLTGDQDIRIDFTNPANQITGLDLDGDGTIERNGEENVIADSSVVSDPADGDFEIVDAAPRNPADVTDTASNFLGDIDFDGTGFGGDGTSTDGNIVLGGLGADTVLGGIGNDFLSGGGTVDGGQDSLSGGRNADFFFSSLSQLSPTSGDNLTIDGGSTTDDSAAGNNTPQDADWIMLEASDDDEPVMVNLADESNQSISTNAGASAGMTEIENVDASGNLFGFLDGIDTQIGEGAADDRVSNANQAIGATAQLDITGSVADNVLIGGYDNDRIAAGSGNDLLVGGGDPGDNNNPNLQGIENNGSDELLGGLGNDDIVFEADGGIIDGGDQTSTTFNSGTAPAFNFVSDDVNVDGAALTFETAGSGSFALKIFSNPDDDGSAASFVSVAVDAGSTAAETAQRVAQKLNNTGLFSEPVTVEGDRTVFIDEDSTDSENLGFAEASGDASAVQSAINGDDTLWLTDGALGTATAEDMTTDGVMRFDLAAQNLENAAGYGGADVDGTQDQTNYTSAGDRVTTTDMENVNATGLGAVDFTAAGTNDPELGFDNQQNSDGLAGVDLDLRGTAGSNTLLANSGKDTLEGRGGNDVLMGGGAEDDFVFSLGTTDAGSESGPTTSGGDGLDAIQRAVDADGDGLWDNFDRSTGTGDWGRDFGIGGTQNVSDSSLILRIEDDTQPNAELGEIVSRVTSIESGVRQEDGTFKPFKLESDAIQNATTFAELEAAIATEIANSDPAVANNLSVSRNDNTIIITDAQGRELADDASEGGFFNVALPADSNVQTTMTFGQPEVEVTQDELVFASYEDRADGELVDDDANIDSVGDPVSLGNQNYAEDLVASFASDNATQGGSGTTLSEGQSYTVDFSNLANEDEVTLTVNGVTYTATVGQAPDGSDVDSDFDEGTKDFSSFLARFAALINSRDDDTQAGSISVTASGNSLTIEQGNFNGGESVFMHAPVVDVSDNSSGGESAAASVSEASNSSVFLRGYDGRDGNLGADNVRFVGESGVNRSVLATAKSGGDSLSGLDAIAVDTIDDADSVANDYSLHGDDQLFTGAGDDTAAGLTGDDRIYASPGTDSVDGGEDHYVDPNTDNVRVLNEHEAAAEELTGALINEQNAVGINNGYQDTLVVQQSDYGPDATFTVELDAGLITDPGDSAVLDAGVTGTVTEDASGDTTTFSDFEAVRTVSGGNTVANQGRDTLDLQALSDATLTTAASGTADFDAAGVDYSMASGEVSLRRDRDDDDANVNDNGSGGNTEVFTTVRGVENVIGGAADDTVTIDQAEAGKDNEIDLGAETGNSDEVIYDYSGIISTIEAGLSMTINVNSAADTDTVVTDGASLPAAATDTLTNVERIDITQGNVATAADDALDLSGFANGAVLNMGTGIDLGETVSGVSDSSTGDDAGSDKLDQGGIASAASPGDEALIVDGVDKLEDVTGSGANDRVVLSDGTTSDHNLALAGGNDIVDYRNETSDLSVQLSTDGSQTDVVSVTGEQTDTVGSAENYLGGQGSNEVDLTAATAATTVEFSAEDELRDPNGEDDPSGNGDFRRAEVRNTADGAVYANLWESGSANAWDSVLGGAQDETILLTDTETGFGHTFALGGGSNTVDASAVTAGSGPTNLTAESLGNDSDDSHNFDGDAVSATGDLTLLASADSSTDLIDVGDLAEAIDFDGVGGNDTKSTVVNLNQGVVRELANGAVVNTVNVANFENIAGSSVVDTLTGDGNDNVIDGLGNADTLDGSGGVDTIDGGAGNDRIIGGSGDDSLTGSGGVDTFVYTPAAQDVDGAGGDTGDTTDDAITDFASGTDGILAQIEDGALGNFAISSGNFDNTGGTADGPDVEIDFDTTALGEVVIETDGFAAGDARVEIAQSGGADSQDLGASGIAAATSVTLAYTDQGQSTLGARDVIDDIDLTNDTIDFSAFDLDRDSDGDGTADRDLDGDGTIALDEIAKVTQPVSVDNTATLSNFFEVTREVDGSSTGQETFDVPFFLQKEGGSTDYRLFFDANEDGNFNQADDMVIDFTNEQGVTGGSGATVGEIYDALEGTGGNANQALDAGVASDFFLLA